MTECCGQPRAGRFCSECGKPLEDSPLLELLKHCRTVEKLQRKQLKRWQATTAYKEGDEQALRCKDRYQRLSAQWKARGDALAELMAKAENEAPQC